MFGESDRGAAGARSMPWIIATAMMLASLTLPTPALSAEEDWTFQLGLAEFRHAQNTDETPTGISGTQSIEVTFANLALGYRIGSFLAGARYLAATLERKNSLQNSPNKTIEEDNLNIWGLMAGYINDRLTLQVSLVPLGAKNHKLTAIGRDGVDGVKTATYNAAMGETLDISYSFDARGVKFGPLLSFATLKYGTKTQDGKRQKLSPQMSDDFIMPSFCLRIDF